MLCLTVYESKGLEFDDVILFNFFAMGEIKTTLWKLLGHIREEKTYREELPDWIMDIGEGEEDTFIEAAVTEAVEQYRAEKKIKELEEKAQQKLQLEEEQAKKKADAEAAGEDQEEQENAVVEDQAAAQDQ